MDGVGPAPAPALAASSATPPRGFRISNAGVSGLTAASLILLLVYLGGRFLWNYRKEAAASSAAQASSPQPGSSGVAVSLLPVFVHVDAETTSECAVCLAEFADGEAGRRLPRCGHGFHEACIETWLRINTTCPLCRAPAAANEPVMR